jgi:Nucleotide modification associated domain 3
VPYSEILFGKRTLLEICRHLKRKKKIEGEFAHLDPDLCRESLAQRPEGWRPAFGQSGASASHLNNQCVDKGDLFIFFG